MLMFTLLSAALASPPPDVGVDWEVYTTSPVLVECATVNGAPWCRSQGTILAPVAGVVTALKDMRHNADQFASVVKIDILPEDTLRVVLDYPAPLDDRDYVARYVYTQQGDQHFFRWTPVPNAAPQEAGVVRLPEFAGEWRLTPTAEGHTQVRYTWQAAIHGSFPSWAYATAWKRAGYEALHDLAGTQGAPLAPPAP